MEYLLTATGRGNSGRSEEKLPAVSAELNDLDCKRLCINFLHSLDFLK